MTDQIARVIHLRRARDLMDRRYAEDLDLRQMADAAGFSRFHFLRSFKDAFGETPAAYLTRRRVERAKDLLRSANLTVTEICFLVGFSSVGSFSSRFSDLVGCSPSEYRKRTETDRSRYLIPGCYLMVWTRPQPDPAVQSSNSGEAF
jgi:AraC-like DNA-binding protein